MGSSPISGSEYPGRRQFLEGRLFGFGALPNISPNISRLDSCGSTVELVHRYRFATRDEARRAITAWIHRYNTRRLHSSIGRIPPIEWEISCRRQEQQAA